MSLSLTNILNGLWDRSKSSAHNLLLARVLYFAHFSIWFRYHVFLIITYCWCFELTNHFFPRTSDIFLFDIFNILEEHKERFMRIPWEATDFCSPWEEHRATSNWALNVIMRKIGGHCTPRRMLLLLLLLLLLSFFQKIR